MRRGQCIVLTLAGQVVLASIGCQMPRITGLTVYVYLVQLTPFLRPELLSTPPKGSFGRTVTTVFP